MWCASQFAGFDRNISLDSTRLDRIKSAFGSFVSFCEEDPQLRAAMVDTPFFQGSVATTTAIKPLVGDEFDVDIIYPFSLRAFGSPTPGPGAIIAWFFKRLRTRKFYADNLIIKPRCARIDYAGDFHLDIIPSTREVASNQPYAVPTRDLASWKTNDPIGFTRWVLERDARAGRFSRSVRMLKRWRDANFDVADAPSSILLVTMLGNHEPTATYRPPLENPLYTSYREDAAYLYDMLRLTHSCLLLKPDNHPFMHPTIPGDNLAHKWNARQIANFQNKLQECINWISKGIFAKTEAEAIFFYKKVFGDSFPSY